MTTKDHFVDLKIYILSAVFSGTFMAFTVDILRALVLGLIGGFAGMLGKWIWLKLFPKQ